MSESLRMGSLTTKLAKSWMKRSMKRQRREALPAGLSKHISKLHTRNQPAKYRQSASEPSTHISDTTLGLLDLTAGPPSCETLSLPSVYLGTGWLPSASKRNDHSAPTA